MDEKFFRQLCNIESSDSRMSRKSKDRLQDIKEFNFDTADLKIDLEQLKTLIANAHDIGFVCGWNDKQAKMR
jgi:hypothetical protein